MLPQLLNIDHIHINVPSWQQAEPWYARVLGLKPVESFRVWAVDNGPLTFANKEQSVHLALFESSCGRSGTVAFSSTAEQFMSWQDHLQQQAVNFTLQDHALSWSIYFNDPFANHYEITCYQYHRVATKLKESDNKNDRGIKTKNNRSV